MQCNDLQGQQFSDVSLLSHISFIHKSSHSRVAAAGLIASRRTTTPAKSPSIRPLLVAVALEDPKFPTARLHLRRPRTFRRTGATSLATQMARLDAHSLRRRTTIRPSLRLSASTTAQAGTTPSPVRIVVLKVWARLTCSWNVRHGVLVPVLL